MFPLDFVIYFQGNTYYRNNPSFMSCVCAQKQIISLKKKLLQKCKEIKKKHFELLKFVIVNFFVCY